MGVSSFGVVEAIQRGLREATGARRKDLPKIGHGGTLDPFATGLLVVCLGRAVLDCLSTSTYIRLAALMAPMQPTRWPFMSSRLARAMVAANCDCNRSSARLTSSGVRWWLS